MSLIPARQAVLWCCCGSFITMPGELRCCDFGRESNELGEVWCDVCAGAGRRSALLAL